VTRPDCYDLDRFVTAQASIFDTALAELRAGQKRSHWMWFVFPQLRGLGISSTAQFYGLSSLAEARAYLAHPVLGPRLLACTKAMLAVEGRSAHQILGSPDDLKFRSCMTLFDIAADAPGNLFQRALDRYCEGVGDERSLRALGETGRPARDDDLSRS
jgi:uncharacterized protein (DUF1810 family)